jgi:hypothetical protein
MKLNGGAGRVEKMRDEDDVALACSMVREKFSDTILRVLLSMYFVL